MTPRNYATLGNKLKGRKRLLWFTISISMAIIIAMLTSANLIESVRLPLELMAIPIFILLFTWGLILTVYWFAAEGKMDPGIINSHTGFKKTFNVFCAWYGAFFLSVWFLVVFFGIPLWALNLNSYGQ